MYQGYWGLRIKPFENISDINFFYHSIRHEEAFMRLLYVATEEKGCGVLTGTYGTGKTFVMHMLMNELEKLGRKSILIPNPSFNSPGILKDFAYRLGINTEGDKADILHRLEENLISYARERKNAVIIVDEAHTIETKEPLEDLRMFLNLNYMGKFLVTLIFAGQPEFNSILKTVRQLDQRIALKYTLAGFTRKEVFDYILFRISIAGRKEQLFEENAIELIWKHSGGIPRVINNICDIALLFGFHYKVTLVNEKIVEEAWQSLEGTSIDSRQETT